MEIKMYIVGAREVKGRGNWPDGNPRKDQVLLICKGSQALDSLPERFYFEPGNAPRISDLRMGQEILIEGNMSNGRFYAEYARIPAKVA